MSGEKRGEDQGADPDSDLINAPYLDEDEPAEVAWLRAREQDPGAPAPSPVIARDYAELEDLLDSLPAGSSDESWQGEVLRRATAAAALRSHPRRRLRRWVAAGTLAATAAAVAVFMLRPRPHPSPEDLEIEIRHGQLVRGGGTAAVVGDRLIIRTRGLPGSELHVYRADGAPVAHCPAGPGCIASADGGLSLEVELEAPVLHHVILADGVTAPLPAGSMNEYLAAAHAGNARIKTRQIEVH